MNRDFVDLLRTLSDAEARFLVVGAFAVGRYGRPRATGDLDLWIDRAPENVRRVYGALKAFGAPLESLREEELAQPDLVFQMGVAPGRIDVLTSLTAVEFEPAWSRREMGELGGLSIPFIGRDDLIHNKRSLGRPRDLADASELEGG